LSTASTIVQLAQVASSVCAAIGLGFAGYQMYTARRTANLQSLQKFYEHAIERERALLCTDEAERRFAFNEFLQFLELYAFAHNRNLYGDASEELVRHKLADSFNVLNEVKAWHPQIENAIDTSTSMIEFRKFRERHREEIERRAEERRRSQAKLAVA
jgi:hypothetical protein